MKYITRLATKRNIKVLVAATIFTAFIFYINSGQYDKDYIITDQKSYSPNVTGHSTLSMEYPNVTASTLHTLTNTSTSTTSRVTDEASNTARVTDEASNTARVTEEASTTSRVTDEASTTSSVTDKASTTARVTDPATTTSRVTQEASTTSRVTDEASTLGEKSTTNTIGTIAPIQKMMTAYTPGRLGNKMGVHAASLGLAQINGYKTVMEKEMVTEMGRYFDLSTPEMDESSRNLTWNVIAVTDYIIEEYRHWNYSYVQLYGYVNSWTFFHHIKPTIVKEYTFKKALQNEAQRILQEITKKIQRNATFVGVHVRRGDYVQVMPEDWKGVIADRKYLEEAMGIFRGRYKDSVFVVVSDDKKWCEENINYSMGDVYIVGNSDQSSPGQDMATLVACNHTIMTIGTFGFWASYLCGGDVIYLANYTLPVSPLLDIIRYNSSYLPEWHGIDADLSPLMTTTQRSP